MTVRGDGSAGTRSAAGTSAMSHDDGGGDAPIWIRLSLGGVMVLFAATLVGVLLGAPDRAPHLEISVRERLADTGMSHPVTGVLLGFRAYDTLLEIVVLLVGMVAVWSMDRGSRKLARKADETGRDLVLGGFARFLVPLVGVVVVYLTWVGAYAPGGAFAAGALLAGIGVFLAVSGFLRPPTAESRGVRGAVAVGVYAFVLMGLVGIPWTGAFLALPVDWAYPATVALEVVLTVSIAVALVELFVDVPAVPQRDPAFAELSPTGDPLGRLLGVTERVERSAPPLGSDAPASTEDGTPT